MEMHYNDSDDLLHLRLSDLPVTRTVAYGPKGNVGYAADGQLVEMTLLGVKTWLKKAEEEKENEREDEDETTIVLTERESLRLLELIESPPPRSDRLLAALV